ncbi:TIGR03773 family transporter-associated surface protein [Kribbella sp.]|uniref:TIGR03773 family transporter-associated surface protein n=1 Tax=Kribbella sp. TaxID=1871183 RepID=UPI002D2FE7D5|nr:TIGR03773 family transporter-associated surface protein [Kribbella sp.]HZX03508.1 TIGR03773 family transporter-associated surface protein [Kribbella sp.]
MTTVLSVGHVDVAARTVGSGLRFQVKDGTQGTAVWRDPGTVAFQVKPSADEVVPASPSYRFLGAAGATVWQIPQTQAEELLWAGWNTESVDYSTLAGPVRWSLDKVVGPGKVAVYQFDQFGEPLISFDSGKPLPQSISLAGPTHAHGNWAFTKLGVYKLTFTYSATSKSGQPLKDTATLAVVVGPDLGALCPGGPAPTTEPTGTPTTAPSGTPTTGPTGEPTASPKPTSGPQQPTQHRTTAPTSDPRRSAPSLRPCITVSVPTRTTSSPTAEPSAGTTSTTASPAGTTLTNGHADYAVRIEGSGLKSRLKDGTKAGDPVWRDPAAVTVRLNSAAAATVPGGAFSFLGAAGSSIWQIPQTQKNGVVWLGWNTEALTAAQVYGGGVDWRLDKVTGPGRMAVFEFDSFGQPKIIFNSADGLPDAYRIPLGTHAHGNWAFTAAGTYRATFTHSATLANGKQSADTATLTFVVGPSGGARSVVADTTPASTPSTQPAPTLSTQPAPTPSTQPTVTAGPESALTKDQQPAASDCKLAMTGGSFGPGLVVAAAVLVLLGVVTVIATRRGTR